VRYLAEGRLNLLEPKKKPSLRLQAASDAASATTGERGVVRVRRIGVVTLVTMSCVLVRRPWRGVQAIVLPIVRVLETMLESALLIDTNMVT
jgi:hypothetical protein